MRVEYAKLSKAAMAELTMVVICGLLLALMPYMSSNMIVEALVFQALIGLIVILAGTGLIGLYGVLTKNDREMHELVRIFRLIAYPILVLVLLHALNISIGNLLIGAGFLGIVIGLAAQSTLGNAFAGLSILYANPFKAGDKITLTPSFYGIQAPTHPHEVMFTEIIGTVRSVGVIYTRIMKDDSSLMYIPNSIIIQSLIQNQSRISERLIRIRLDVQRNTDFELFRLKLDELLSENIEDYDKLLGLHVKISLVSSEQDLGIVVTARARILDYDSMSQWLSETSVKALLETQKIQSEDSAPVNGRADAKRNARKKG